MGLADMDTSTEIYYYDLGDTSISEAYLELSDDDYVSAASFDEYTYELIDFDFVDDEDNGVEPGDGGGDDDEGLPPDDHNDGGLEEGKEENKEDDSDFPSPGVIVAIKRLAVYMRRNYDPSLPWDICICSPPPPGKPKEHNRECLFCSLHIEDICPKCTRCLKEGEDPANHFNEKFTCFPEMVNTCPYGCTRAEKVEEEETIPEEIMEEEQLPIVEEPEELPIVEVPDADAPGADELAGDEMDGIQE